MFDENVPSLVSGNYNSAPIDYSSLPFQPDVFSSSSTSPSAPASAVPNLVVSPSDLDSPQLLKPSTSSNLSSSSSSSSVDIQVVPSTPLTSNPLPPPSTPIPQRVLPPPRSSSCERHPSSRGILYSQLREAEKAKSESIIASQRATSAERLLSIQPSNEQGGDVENPFISLCSVGTLEPSPSQVIDTSLISLDVEDYLSRDKDAFFEAILLSVRSDRKRNPLSPNYDLKIPPANYQEAMLHPDADQW
ncbi:hypothetical protein JR316_0011987 [Psilocybe cubensis]|uniref:Uncharacterized protein n=2 Tax=Psilocybe cubensis TaxID=181762 RepID=A0A8H7XLD9_PSICU|nr:hypothetical protein JR316_0011987 [Psilocybe cubensis]KAH9476412.1 hypothetical protein JR316_0011987 [Psilocybe cubensis]